MLEPACDTLSWKRRNLWTVYPEDHIGRLTGTAKAFRDPSRKADDLLTVMPTWPFAQDQTFSGTADFRSTKRCILRATIGSAKAALHLAGGGARHVRVAVEGDGVRFWDLHLSASGKERYNKELGDEVTIGADHGNTKITGSTRWTLVKTERNNQ